MNSDVLPEENVDTVVNAHDVGQARSDCVWDFGSKVSVLNAVRIPDPVSVSLSNRRAKRIMTAIITRSIAGARRRGTRVGRHVDRHPCAALRGNRFHFAAQWAVRR
ncbi:hypothetical protein IFT54_00750 [Sphingomonas sp. CFBP 13714]|uniref:hypothetical protein n=1 Tax=Sphingomonas sp. CFBP 13714 TaxID=2775308 RepID=UPI00177AC795|nr:hypothetical protein [Sphingomonas sp. CFBP 13714]MBD8698335.1 hypothetical protein [Sphingomonas sp. CFBP 13714]